MPTRAWTCPYCRRDQLATDQNARVHNTELGIGSSKHGYVAFKVNAARCLNPECNEVALSGALGSVDVRRPGDFRPLETWQLRPSSSAKPYPDFIPEPLREDYEEACKIRDSSPKACATLARRCLQGMIRDFAGISKPRLIEEIKELRGRVDAGTAPKGVEPETIDAIDAVRSIGNIGAHMEKDISLIVDVDPGEAQALIELIEMLFDEWYVARDKRQRSLARVQQIASEKQAAKTVPLATDDEAQSVPDAVKSTD